MPKVNLPRASWETLLIILDDYERGVKHPLVASLHKEIEDQVYSQEY